MGTFLVTWRAENLDAAAMGTSLDTSVRMMLVVVGWEWRQAAAVAVHRFDLALVWAAVNAFGRAAVAWLVGVAEIELSWTCVVVVFVVVVVVAVVVVAAG